MPFIVVVVPSSTTLLIATPTMEGMGVVVNIIIVLLNAASELCVCVYACICTIVICCWYGCYFISFQCSFQLLVVKYCIEYSMMYNYIQMIKLFWYDIAHCYIFLLLKAKAWLHMFMYTRRKCTQHLFPIKKLIKY